MFVLWLNKPEMHFLTSDFKDSRIFELVHCDLWGPYTTPSSCDAIYFLTLVDDFSRAVWVYLLVNKTEVAVAFSKFFAMVDRQFESTVNFIRSDNGTEFQHMISYFMLMALFFKLLLLQLHNRMVGLSVNINTYLMLVELCCFKPTYLSLFWGECVLTAVHLINRTPSGVNCENFSPRYRTLLAAIIAGHELRTFKEAMKDSCWRAAIAEEVRALEDNGTWSLQPLPHGKKALGCKWFYRIKYNADGTVEHLKARLVILGNHQVEGVDYTETFTPVAKTVTVRTFLAVAASKN